MLQIKNLVCVRDEIPIFNKLSFNLQSGQGLQILGANGSGKSTLLRAIAGLYKNYTGQIINHIDLCYIGHKSCLHPDLTVAQNLEFVHAFLDIDNISIDTALAHFGLEHKKDSKLRELSAGEAQQISLARLFSCQKKLWLLDEPLVHLDTQAIELFKEICLKHVRVGGMLIIATHNVLNLEAYATQHIEMRA